MSSKQKQAFKSAPGEKQADGKNHIEMKIIKLNLSDKCQEEQTLEFNHSDNVFLF